MLLSVSLGAVVPLIATPDQAAAAPADCATLVREDVRAAALLAAECDESVEVLGERSETTQVFVDASGVGRLESAVVPQRVHRKDGTWADIDLALRPVSGGLAPVASTADMTFSGGGTGALVTWREGAATFELSWPGSLPVPRVSGATAIYDDVLPGVNLHVTADRAGFRHVLEVLTPQAATNPALRQVRYGLGGDMRVTRAVDGGLSLADASGEELLQASPAVMWDSSISTPTPGLQERVASPEDTGQAGTGTEVPVPSDLVSTAQRPGVLAASAPVEVAVSGSDLTLTPDPNMMAASPAAFPLFIDPAFSKLRSKWAYASSNGENNDTSSARVGLSPESGARYRSFFSFDTSAMSDTTVLTAKVLMKLDHSSSCEPTWVHLYRTGSWTASSGNRLAWSSYPLGSSATWLDSWEGNANEAGGCGSQQQNSDAVFEGGTLLQDVQAQVGSSNSYWVGLCACNQEDEWESAQDRWKKFFTDRTYLVATFDVKPNPPVGLAFTTTTDCYRQCASPAVLRSFTPTLRAQVQDRFGGVLGTAFEIRTSASLTGTIAVSSTTMPFASVTTVGNATGVATSKVPAGSLVAGVTYYWHATSMDEAGLWSGWGSWYSFTIDNTPPTVSNVTSTQYPFKSWGATPGTAGTFAFTAAGAAEYTWDIDGGSATTTTSASATYTPATDMVHTLHVKAKDSAGNTSSTYDYQFWVSPVPNAYSHWTFDETDPAKTAADTGSGFSARNPGTLTGGAHFVPGYLKNALHVSGAVGDGAVTSGPVLDTTKSFTVMAWVRPGSLSARPLQTFLTQDGSWMSRFQLQYRQDANGGRGGWCFTLSSADATGASKTISCAGQNVGIPTNGEWAHVAGRYDRVTGKMRVYVMGDPNSCAGEVTEATAPPSWSATAPFRIGHDFSGDIDDVRAYQRVLSDSEICQQASQ
ncbi:LamG-like jellyroll fold domain-containing protein [Glycomyces sp. NPDC047369]|uniref:LamG-like jellyroll fold domain-containing protein n=1 Tax=Micromonospora TaxID=1873 RepID=UPI00069143F8|nr:MULTISPECIES: LamG-like jellyroll fold domain-containing protein [Micromonospora]MBQ1028900.1 LamG domain-containing protein [Micromonospora sp. C97]